jgi:competence protein ComEC
MRAYLARATHISWHIAWASVGVLAGVALAPMLTFGSISLLVIAVALFGLAAVRRLAWMVLLALLAGLLIGLWRGGAEQQHRAAFEPFYGRQLTVQSTVSEDPSVGPRGDLRILIKDTYINDRKLQGTVWISASRPVDIKRDDHVRVSGQLAEGFGSISASMHRAQIAAVERPVPGDLANQARDAFGAGARRAIQEPEASLGLGFLTGQRSSLPEDLDAQLQILGLTHIVVASGYNLTILVQLARRLFANISKYVSVLVSSLLIFSFIAITGVSPSMSRAGLVAGLGLAAWYYGRTVHPLVLLPTAAAITVLVNPTYVRGDLGWYLSFASFVGVLVLAPLLRHYFWGSSKPGMLSQILLDTFAAQIATLPLILFVFGQYSLLALPANMAILPFVPLAMLLTFIGGLAGVLLPGLASIAGLPAELLLRGMTLMIERLGSVPWAQGELEINGITLAVLYLCLFLVLWFLWHKTRHNFRKND